jgi:hypothetical protein
MNPEDRAPLTARGAETVTEVLRTFSEQGIDTQFVPGPARGALRCTNCASISSAAEYTVLEERRLEGASDPDDLVLVVAASCPVCRASGALVLGYGPEASEVDTDLVLGLTRGQL